MIKKLAHAPYVNKLLKKKLRRLRPFKGGEWELKTKEVIAFKNTIKKQLNIIQNEKCAYCGFTLYVTSDSQIEHIAPKGGSKRPKYVNFSFLRFNLVLSCVFCNGFYKKGTFDTVVKEDINYRKCVFKIVHPYFDDPTDHYNWVSNLDMILIKAVSEKAKNSITIFELDSLRHSQERAKNHIMEELKSKGLGDLSKAVDFISSYKPSK